MTVKTNDFLELTYKMWEMSGTLDHVIGLMDSVAAIEPYRDGKCVFCKATITSAAWDGGVCEMDCAQPNAIPEDSECPNHNDDTRNPCNHLTGCAWREIAALVKERDAVEGDNALWLNDPIIPPYDNDSAF